MDTPTFTSRKKEVRDSRKLLCEQLYSSLARAFSMREHEMRRLVNLENHITSAPAGRQLQEEGAMGKSRIVVSGWACQQRILEDGRRQIFSFFIPGDAINYRKAGMTQANLVAITGMLLLDATPFEEMASTPGAHAGMVDYFARMEQKRIGFLYNHIVRLGSETAYERVHGLLKELFQRLSNAGFCQNHSVQLPLTQEVLADCLGFSAVHVNRVLQQMRQDGVIGLRDGRLRLGSGL